MAKTKEELLEMFTEICDDVLKVVPNTAEGVAQAVDICTKINNYGISCGEMIIEEMTEELRKQFQKQLNDQI